MSIKNITTALDFELDTFGSSANDREMGPPKSEQTSANIDSESQIDIPDPEKTEVKDIPPARQITYLEGWRLHLLTIAICICMFVTNIEISIVSTSLVTIADGFHGFQENTWIASAYQITYTAFLVIWAKLSDIFGRKTTLLASLLLFIAFSAGCGAAQSLPQLLVCRAFQGLGASGTFAIPTAIFYEMVPKSKYPSYSSLMFLNILLPTVVGPVLGGAVSKDSTWRWIFLVQIPLGVIALVIVILVLPMKFPYHGSELVSSHLGEHQQPFRTSLLKLDCIGAFLLLAATFLVVTPFLEVSANYSWSSPTIIVLLVLAGLLWPGLMVWEWTLSRAKRLAHIEPILPWRFAHNRLFMGIIITSLIMGIPSTIISFEIPQRFQAVNAVTPLGAGIRLLPFVCAQPLASAMANAVVGATRIPPLFVLLAGIALQALGLGLMTMLPDSGSIPHAQYGYELIMGWGCGLTFSIILLLVPFTVKAKDIAVAISSVIQIRLTGQAIGLAIATGILNSYLTSHLSDFVSPSQLQRLLQDVSTVHTFPIETQQAVVEVFGKAYNLIIKVILGLALAQFLSASLLWNKPQLSIKHQ